MVDCDDRCPHATLYTLAHALHRGPAQGFPVNTVVIKGYNKSTKARGGACALLAYALKRTATVRISPLMLIELAIGLAHRKRFSPGRPRRRHRA